MPPWCCWLSGRAFQQVRCCLCHHPDFQWSNVARPGTKASRPPVIPRVSHLCCCRGMTVWICVVKASQPGWLQAGSAAEAALRGMELLLPLHPAHFLFKRSHSSSPLRAAPPGASIPSSRKLPERSCGLWRAMTEMPVRCSR